MPYTETLPHMDTACACLALINSKCLFWFALIFFDPHLKAFFFIALEREEGRERNTDRLPSFILGPGIVHVQTRDGTCNLGRCPAWPGIEPTTTFGLQDDAPTHLATPARAGSVCFLGQISPIVMLSIPNKRNTDKHNSSRRQVTKSLKTLLFSVHFLKQVIYSF